jgi:2,3-dihydroxybenzoate decarboxylase
MDEVDYPCIWRKLSAYFLSRASQDFPAEKLVRVEPQFNLETLRLVTWKYESSTSYHQTLTQVSASLDTRFKMRGTIAIEEAIINPAGVASLSQWHNLLTPSDPSTSKGAVTLTAHERRLLDIHDQRLKSMDEEGVEYMLLSLTSPGCQGEADPSKAEKMATGANDYLAGEVKKNPARFGALAALSMHDPAQAAQELKRAVEELGMFGGLVNDFQSTGEDGGGKEYFDTPKYDPFWAMVQDLDVPIYFHPKYAVPKDLEPGTKYGDRTHLLGAAVQFHLDLSFHLYAMCSSGTLDRFPNVQIVAGHLGEK